MATKKSEKTIYTISEVRTLPRWKLIKAIKFWPDENGDPQMGHKEITKAKTAELREVVWGIQVVPENHPNYEQIMEELESGMSPIPDEEDHPAPQVAETEAQTSDPVGDEGDEGQEKTAAPAEEPAAAPAAKTAAKKRRRKPAAKPAAKADPAPKDSAPAAAPAPAKASAAAADDLEELNEKIEALMVKTDQLLEAVAKLSGIPQALLKLTDVTLETSETLNEVVSALFEEDEDEESGE